MKKYISIILLSAILLTGDIAFVQGSTLANVKSKITQSAAVNRAKLSEIAPLQEKVRTNRAEILSLKLQASDGYNKAKSHIKGLIKNKDNLTPTQIESTKQSLNVIKQDKQSIADTYGEIQKNTLDLRIAKSEKNFDAVTNSLNSIIAVQNTRIKDLQKIINDMNNAATM